MTRVPGAGPQEFWHDIDSAVADPGFGRQSLSELGVIGVTGLLDLTEVESLRDVLADLRTAPTYISQDGLEQLVFGTTVDARLRNLVLGSNIARIAAIVLGSADIRLLYDHVFIKNPGSPVPSSWHHDRPYLPLRGGRICSVWVALDPIDFDNGGLEFVVGSHRWPGEFKAETPYIQQGREADELARLPDIERLRSSGVIRGGPLAAGDAWVFDARTVHGAPPNASSLPRRALATRWFTPDARYAPRPYTIDLPGAAGLRDGEALDSDDFPRPHGPVASR